MMQIYINKIENKAKQGTIWKTALQFVAVGVFCCI
jgi:hypothetical protein